MPRALRGSALAVIVLQFLVVLSTPAEAGWRSINTLNYDDGGRACTNAVRFSLAHFDQKVRVKITNTTPEPDVIVHPLTTRKLYFAPVPDLFGDFGEPYLYSRNLQLSLNPQPQPGDELLINFRNAPGGSGASSSVTETVEDCTEGPHFKGFDTPIVNPDFVPALNPATPGTTVKLSFSLLGDRGLSIFTEGPTFAPIPCAPTDTTPAYQPTLAKGGLRYRTATDRYLFRWRAPADLAGCYAFWFRNVDDGLTHRALFDFG
jgi:hypothetical protein